MNYDYRNANIYAAAFHAFRINALPAIGLAIVFVFLSWLEVKTDSIWLEYLGPMVLTAAFAYTIHATIIFDLDKAWKAMSAD